MENMIVSNAEIMPRDRLHYARRFELNWVYQQVIE